ncbi:hypothetical protein EV186_102402 [Labedaea rhizosphaerae]|uniref:Membrane-associated oxidoreductase n=2 Tax=Labedaea rhizosphaerae TaxID=598644 RepID=A0A4V3CZQ2_LABRH|nr:hypothetical protein EV186_102402 [Labedaea rhizosphaerae]
MGRRALLRAGRRGVWADLAGGRLDADVVRAVCLDLDGVDPRGLLIRRGEVRGSLDLSGLTVPVPLRFDDCTFSDVVRVDSARLHELALTNCRLDKGLQANGVHVEHDLDLSGSHGRGAISVASTIKRSAIWLCEAEIGGRLLCIGTRVDADGERAIQADQLRVGGAIQLVNGFVANGEVRLLGASIAGSVNFSGARIDNPGGPAVNMDEAVIGGNVVMTAEVGARRPVINGWIWMSSARIAGYVRVRNAELTATGDKEAIWAPRLSVNGDVTFDGDCTIRGSIDFSLGDFGTVRFGSGCVLDAPDGTALDLTNAELRSGLILHEGVEVAGTLRLEGATISGNVTLQRISLSRPGGRSLLAASSVRVAGDVELQGLRAEGGLLNLRGADLGNTLDMSGATLDNPGALTVRLLGARVRGSVRLTDGFASNGGVMLRRSIIEGRLDLRDGEFVSTADLPAIDAESTVAQGGMYLTWRRVESSVTFISSRTTVLADDPDRWPERFAVSGMTYERYGSLGWDGKARARWLARQATFDSGPYEQAATVFRQHGRPADAEQLLIMQRRQAHRESMSARRPWSRWPRAAVHSVYGLFGYGYRPGRAGWPLVLLLGLVFLIAQLPMGLDTMRATDPRGNVYSPGGRVITVDPAPASPELTGEFVVPASTPARADPCGDGQVRCFNPFFYAVDTVVPLVSLNQRATWYPDPHAPNGRLVEWLLDVATLLGWALSSILVLSAARLARNV